MQRFVELKMREFEVQVGLIRAHVPLRCLLSRGAAMWHAGAPRGSAACELLQRYHVSARASMYRASVNIHAVNHRLPWTMQVRVDHLTMGPCMSRGPPQARQVSKQGCGLEGLHPLLCDPEAKVDRYWHRTIMTTMCRGPQPECVNLSVTRGDPTVRLPALW
jgi:hypothetical protein